MKVLVLSYVINGKLCTIWERWGCIYYGIIPSKNSLKKGLLPDGTDPNEIEYLTKIYTTFQEAHQELTAYATSLIGENI